MNELDALLKELNNPRSSYFPRNPTPSTILNGNHQILANPENPEIRNINYNDMRYQEPTPEQSPMYSKQNLNMSNQHTSMQMQYNNMNNMNNMNSMNQNRMMENDDYSSDEDNEKNLNSIMAGLNMISPTSRQPPNQGYKYYQQDKRINGPRDIGNGKINYMNESNEMNPMDNNNINNNINNMKNKINVNNNNKGIVDPMENMKNPDVNNNSGSGSNNNIIKNNDYNEKDDDRNEKQNSGGDIQTKSNNQQKQARKIICATCKNQIKGKVVSCLGKTWHPEHFICQAGCKKLLNPNRFFEKNHLPCCENCHRESFVPRCAYCGDVITEKCITALDTTWHTDHFFCCQCAVQFPAGSGFLEKDGKAYCERDYYRLFATRCGKCGEIIIGEYISALNKEWHNKCFTCKECNCSFPTESFFEYKGMPYCEIHYHLKRGSLCSRCNKPIVGRCISASKKKYHPEHFTCIQCNKLLVTGNEDDEYKEINGNPFCGQCASNISF